MSAANEPTILGPQVYASWRATALGAVTDAIEERLIMELTGDLVGRDVLDVGCGDGALASAMAARGAKATGVDPDPAMLAAARSREATVGQRATFLEGRVERLPFPDASFDVVTAVTVLCFVADAAGAVRELARVVRPGGRVVIGELGVWSLWAAIRRIRGWFGSATWRAAHFRAANELRSLATQAGLTVATVRGAVYYPPIGTLARALAPVDPWLGRLTSFGAAFIAVAADGPAEQRSGH